MTRPTQTEEQFRRALREVAERYGWSGYHTHRSDRSDAGWPDEVLCKPPRILFVELKTDSKKSKPSPAQVQWLRDLEACGQEVALWRPADWPTILRVLGPRGERASLVLPS
ncbi:hypothetical protein [Aeromicrobium sp. Leaf291]|uniref:hypothetical protein n=1 Tax=Aeromicrobium sp. Leaf291 TaxID=1736325 RepID=UPI0006F52E9B|nr:hypothetical protein [Aeromicrobium sp. Leaf291]KQP81635.1 hypothetical protein ASF35_16525 [Aeromicrobium sp. Leaf291]